METRKRLRVPLNFFKIEDMEETSDDSQQGSNLLKLLGIAVGGFVVLQTLIPLVPLNALALIWMTKAGLRKHPVNWWGRFWAVGVVGLLTLGSMLAQQSNLKAILARARVNSSSLAPTEVVEARQVIRNQTFSALLMDPLNWRRWKTWSETTQMLDHADLE